jgi:hypothetical protein
MFPPTWHLQTKSKKQFVAAYLSIRLNTSFHTIITGENIDFLLSINSDTAICIVVQVVDFLNNKKLPGSLLEKTVTPLQG